MSEYSKLWLAERGYAGRRPRLVATIAALLDDYARAILSDDDAVEECARTLYECDGWEPATWSARREALKDEYRRAARAVLAVLRHLALRDDRSQLPGWLRDDRSQLPRW